MEYCIGWDLVSHSDFRGATGAPGVVLTAPGSREVKATALKLPALELLRLLLATYYLLHVPLELVPLELEKSSTAPSEWTL